MRQIMRGEISPLMTAAIITGLRVKKETVGEITAAAQVMREMSARIEVADDVNAANFVEGLGQVGGHIGRKLADDDDVDHEILAHGFLEEGRNNFV